MQNDEPSSLNIIYAKTRWLNGSNYSLKVNADNFFYWTITIPRVAVV